MRKLVLVSAIVAGTASLSGVMPRPVLAWCYGSYAYACASPAERFAYSPWGYRSALLPLLRRTGVSKLGLGRSAQGSATLVDWLCHAPTTKPATMT